MWIMLTQQSWRCRFEEAYNPVYFTEQKTALYALNKTLLFGLMQKQLS